jgi:serine/threonine-protein kinase
MSDETHLGTELGGYRLLGVLGQGGMGVVYMAEHVRLGRKVALKVLSPELASDERFRDRFVRESRIAASLEHPNIVPVYESAEMDGQLFIVMRYVPGTDLKAIIKEQGPLEPARTFGLLSQIAGALDAAHAEGLVHRDVKPGNVLVAPATSSDTEEHAWLTDFGLTKRVTSESGITATGQFVGTFDYAPPEQFEGKALDARTDVYSLTAVLYECLTGEVPYPRDQDVALMYAHLSASPPKPTVKRPKLPRTVDDVIATGMAKKPEVRFASAGELIRTAGAALGVEGLEAEEAKEWKKRRRRLRRRRRTFAAATILVVVVTAAVLGFLLSRLASPPALQGASLIQIDPQTNSRTGTPVSLGELPGPVAAGNGAVWVGDPNRTRVLQIDPATGRMQSQTSVGSNPSAVAVGPGAEDVWATTASQLWAINRPTSTTATGGVTVGLATGDGFAWVLIGGPSSETKLLGFDPETRIKVSEVTIDVLPRPCCVAVGEGKAWVLGSDESGDSSVVAVDTSTREIGGPLELGRGSPAGLAIGEGSLWSLFSDGRLLKIDPKGTRVIATISTDALANGVAAGEGGIWVLNHLRGQVTRVDPGTGRIAARISLEARLKSIAVGERSVWVTLEAS